MRSKHRWNLAREDDSVNPCPHVHLSLLEPSHGRDDDCVSPRPHARVLPGFVQSIFAPVREQTAFSTSEAAGQQTVRGDGNHPFTEGPVREDRVILWQRFLI